MQRIGKEKRAEWKIPKQLQQLDQQSLEIGNEYNHQDGSQMQLEKQLHRASITSGQPDSVGRSECGVGMQRDTEVEAVPPADPTITDEHTYEDSQESHKTLLILEERPNSKDIRPRVRGY